MPINRLFAEGSPHWELNHDLPILWPWLFDWNGITESRRMHTTVFDAGDRFSQRHRRASRLPFFAALLKGFGELTADRFPRHLDHPPDALLVLDLGSLEGQRPYRHEMASEAWESFFAACDASDQVAALEQWGRAILTPMVLHDGVQRNALMLAARAEELGLERGAKDRATALVWLLFGRPVSRPAKALTLEWIEESKGFPPVAFIPKKRWFRA